MVQDRTPSLPPAAEELDRLLPAVAIFGDPLRDRPTGRRAPVDVPAVKAALAGLNGFTETAHRMNSVTTIRTVAASEADGLAIELKAQRGEPPPPTRSPIQQYFRIRTAALTADQLLWHCLRVIADTAEDLVDAPMSGSDLGRLGSAVIAVLDGDSGPRHESSTPPPPSPRRDLAIEEVWLRRWIIGHQLHALLNVHAAYAVNDAAEALRRGSYNAAVAAVCSATSIVEGFAGARAHALAIPADFYQEVLRPTMLPPLTEVPLSGRMHVEYQGYRRRMEELLCLVPQPAEKLAAAQPRLALAVERLVEADLIDVERHITSVEPLVGDSRSLIQTGKSTENAVSSLRRIRHRRAAAIARHVRFPDSALLKGGHEADRTGHP
ncbi:hypothetical protein [Lentzea sp. NEAU-D7]|uniref:hypothetical protein n=1 Tax=Lentzea sp. NEAU-D7 TaxID=2994667 RepID=UPI00224B5035|nr:hypothetical protein [Lentzea sp. NEAU-D7]MCX2950181.1 hypothetical protein [Lentzea sp. NEAU-D7]